MATRGFATIDRLVTAAVLDAAQVPSVPERLQASGVSHWSLFDGETAVELADVAPYLVVLPRADELRRWLFEELWGESALILLESDADGETLRRHLRRLLMVLDEHGEMFYFRLYDPRVLRSFLPSCDQKQLIEVFGPIGAFVVEDDDPTRARRFRLDAGSLVSETLDVSGRGSAVKFHWKG